ncbi:uncharacterized protein LOC143529689 [Bidens hawaiensis]|uniref:uncharacterized protein LOC143529689 n=1 Tax=Bidens hawaiensis TaxID=980011 RepID=UPI00404AE171
MSFDFDTTLSDSERIVALERVVAEQSRVNVVQTQAILCVVAENQLQTALLVEHGGELPRTVQTLGVSTSQGESTAPSGSAGGETVVVDDEDDMGEDVLSFSKIEKLGPFQRHLNEYRAKGSNKHPRRFQYSWFAVFPNWLEYSPTTHSAYCFLCYIFNDTPNVGNGHDAFTVKGFDNWKKVNDEKKCAFLKHIDCSQHRRAVEFSENLLNQTTHIDNTIDKQSEEELLKNHIRLKASIDTVRWLTFQACGFRGHDETFNSKNQVCSASKRHDELQNAKGVEIKELLELGEIKLGKGENQATTLRRAGDTRWGSHYRYVCSLLNMFHSTHVVLKEIINDTYASSSHRSDADAVYSHTKSFEFVFILHLVKKVMDMLKMDALYTSTRYRYRPRKKVNQPKGINNVDGICLLVENYYPADFTEQEGIQRRVVRLILTLLVSTGTTVRGFSAMKIVMNRLRNRMPDEFLANNLVVYIEREIAEKIDSKSVIDEFKDLKGREAQL